MCMQAIACVKDNSIADSFKGCILVQGRLVININV